MSIKTVIAAALALKVVDDEIDNLQAQKDDLQQKVQGLNTQLDAKKTERTAKVASLKTEAGTI